MRLGEEYDRDDSGSCHALKIAEKTSVGVREL